MQGIIYKVENKTNGKIYIGQTTLSLNRRKRCHLNAEPYYVFHRALHKYKKSNFLWSILDIAYSKKELSDKEIYYIKTLKTKVPFGYNMTNGGESMFGKNNPMFGRIQSLKCKAINRQLRLGTTLSATVRKKIGKSLIGRSCSEKSKEKSRQRWLKNNPSIRYFLFIKKPNEIIIKIKNFKTFCDKELLNYNAARNAFCKWGYHKKYILIKKELVE